MNMTKNDIFLADFVLNVSHWTNGPFLLLSDFHWLKLSTPFILSFQNEQRKYFIEGIIEYLRIIDQEIIIHNLTIRCTFIKFLNCSIYTMMV